MQAKQHSEYSIPFYVMEKAATSAEQAYIFNSHSNCQDCLPNFFLEPWFGWTMVWGTPGLTLLSAICSWPLKDLSNRGKTTTSRCKVITTTSNHGHRFGQTGGGEVTMGTCWSADGNHALNWGKWRSLEAKNHPKTVIMSVSVIFRSESLSIKPVHACVSVPWVSSKPKPRFVMICPHLLISACVFCKLRSSCLSREMPTWLHWGQPVQSPQAARGSAWVTRSSFVHRTMCS